MVAGTKNSSHSGINGKRKTFSDSVNVGNSAISLATTAAEVEMTNDDQQIAFTIDIEIERKITEVTRISQIKLKFPQGSIEMIRCDRFELKTSISKQAWRK